MTAQSPRQLRAALAAGRLTPDDAIERALDHLDADASPVREQTLRTLVAATETRPDRVIDVIDAVDSSLRPGRALTSEELAALRDLARRRPRALSPLVDTLGTALSNPDESQVHPALTATLLGDVGVTTPGVVKPALGPLLNLTADPVTDTVAEAAWAVVKTATNEPATLRPVIAGGVWDLDSDDPATIVSGLETLGRIGWFRPEHLAGLDEIATHVDHPVSDVRAAAIRALGRIAGIHLDASLGIPRPDRVEPYLDRAANRLTDPDSDVRLAAATTLKQVARSDPGAVHEYRDELMQVTDDDRWEVRLAALETLEHAFDSSAFDLHRMQERVLPRLADDDQDVEGAAISLLVTVVDEVRTDSPDIASHLIDLLVWSQFTSRGRFGAPQPLSELEAHEVTPPNSPQYVEIAHALSEMGDDVDQQATANLCGAIARQSPDQQFAAIGILQALLADGDESVRRQVLEEFKALIEADPTVAPMLWRIAENVFKYDPAVRDEAAYVLTACDTRNPAFLADAVELQRRFLREQSVRDDGSEDEDEDESGDLDDLLDSEPSEPTLEPFVDASPQLVTDAVVSLFNSLPAEHDTTESNAELLAHAVASGGRIDLETAETIEEIIRTEDTSPSLVAWLSTVLLLGTTDAEMHDRAIDRLHSFAERQEDTPILSCLRLLVDDKPSLVARVLVNHPPIAALPEPKAETLTEIIAAHPRLSLQCRNSESPFSARTVPKGYANNPKWIGTLSETIPQTVPATDWLRDGFWSDDGELTASLLTAVGRADAVPGDEGLATWTAHPHSDVRSVARTLSGDDPAPSAESPLSHLEDADAATADTVDEIATHLAATDPNHCRRAAELLVTIGSHDSDLRPYVRQHLLASVAALDEVAAPDSLRGALGMLAPKPTDGSTSAPESIPSGHRDRDAIAPVVRQYARFGTPPVRDVALCALRSLPAETVASPIEDVLIDRLRDPDGIVRAQAARTVAHVAGDGLDVTTPLVNAVVDALDGPRHVTIACCEALGHCVAADPSITDRAVSELEIRLHARERGVRRAAASSLARISDVKPDSLVPVADTLIERLCQDRVVRGELLPPVAALPIDEVPKHDHVAEKLLAVLVETDRPLASQAAGQLLISIANDSPGSVRMHLDAVSDRLKDHYDDVILSDITDVEASPLSLYWLLRAVGICTRDNPRIADRFEWLISETIEYVNDSASDGISEYGLPSDDRVTVRGLARVGARAAALGGLDCYRSVLEHWPTDPTKPSPDPSETAHYFTITGEPSRTASVEIVVEHAQPTRVDSVLAELLNYEITLNRNEAIFDSLAKLLPVTEDKRLHRRGVSRLLDAGSDGNWETRTNAIETLAELGATTVVRADEVIAHFLGLFDDANRIRETVADAVVNLLPQAELDAETIFTATRARYEQSQNTPRIRRTSVHVVGKLGTHHPTVRDRAIQVLISAVSDDDRWVRQRAATSLAELATIDPDALRPYEERIEELVNRLEVKPRGFP